MLGDMNFWQLLHMYRTELGYGLCAAIISACLHIQRGDPRRIWVTEAVLAGIVGSTANLALDVFGVVDTKAGVFLAMVVGFIGARTILAKVMEKLGFTFEFKKSDNAGSDNV